MRWACFFAFSTIMLRAGVVAQHDYDAVTDAVASWRMEPGTSVGQSITIPSGTHLSKAVSSVIIPDDRIVHLSGCPRRNVQNSAYPAMGARAHGFEGSLK